MRRVGKHKIVDQTVKKDTSDQTKEIQRLLMPSIPIEDVIKFSDAEHEEGTNRYCFKFPPKWRNISNQDLILGVRSITMINDVPNTQVFGVIFSVEYRITTVKETEKKTHELPKTSIDLKFKVTWSDDASTYMENIFHEFTDVFETELKKLETKEQKGDTPLLDLLKGKWLLVYNKADSQWGLLVDGIDIQQDDNDFIRVLVETEKCSELWNSIMTYSFPFFVAKWRNCMITAFTPPLFTTQLIPNAQLSASFCSRSANNYLGSTSSVFNPPKLYPLTGSDTTFWIDLYSSILESRQGIELPSDFKQDIIIEIQLIAQNRSPYV